MRFGPRLVAPIATTLQGKSAVPAAQNAFADCDALLAVGARFGELATASYGMEVPETLVHVDINPEVFDKNDPATVAIEGDANLRVERLPPSGLGPCPVETKA